MHKHSCTCETEAHSTVILSLSIAELEQQLIDDAKAGIAFTPQYYQSLVAQFQQALGEGMNLGAVTYSDPSWPARMAVRANIFHFSGAKSLEMNLLLNEAFKGSKSFAEFSKAARELLDEFNLNYLKTEYGTARQIAANIHRYYEQLSQSDILPYWEYRTARDSRVREAHRGIDGIILRFDDPAWDSIYPPNGWNCRCIVVAKPEGPALNGEDAIAQLKNTEASHGVSEWDVMKKGNFHLNRAKLGNAFDVSKIYNHTGENLNFKSYGLKPKADFINQINETLPVNLSEDFEPNRWFSDRVGNFGLNDNERIRLLNNTGEPITFSLNTFKTYPAQHKVLQALLAAITSPDEVYMRPFGKSSYALSYIKHYSDVSYKVRTNLTAHGQEIVDYRSTATIDAYRTDFLMFNTSLVE